MVAKHPFLCSLHWQDRYSLLKLVNSRGYDASYANPKNEDQDNLKKELSFHLGLLKPSSSGAYCGQTFDQNHQIIIIIRLVKPTGPPGS